MSCFLLTSCYVLQFLLLPATSSCLFPSTSFYFLLLLSTSFCFLLLPGTSCYFLPLSTSFRFLLFTTTSCYFRLLPATSCPFQKAPPWYFESCDLAAPVIRQTLIYFFVGFSSRLCFCRFSSSSSSLCCYFMSLVFSPSPRCFLHRD